MVIPFNLYWLLIALTYVAMVDGTLPEIDSIDVYISNCLSKSDCSKWLSKINFSKAFVMFL